MNAASFPSVITLLTLDRIRVDAAVSSRDELFQMVAALFASEELSEKEIARALKAREALASTALGHGVAIPHGRIKGLLDARTAFFRTAQPIAFNAPDGKKVSLFFILLVPEHATEYHLKLLAELAQMTNDHQFREALRDAPNANVVCDLLKRQAVLDV
ncbi:MAG: PTS sugar transporter subunit IIA [Burkholderiales bacterium]|nr:PTS sugar transporter subunit IIA [Burkholderiales bacterium]